MQLGLELEMVDTSLSSEELCKTEKRSEPVMLKCHCHSSKHLASALSLGPVLKLQYYLYLIFKKCTG